MVYLMHTSIICPIPCKKLEGRECFRNVGLGDNIKIDLKGIMRVWTVLISFSIEASCGLL
jgi:hypothetical protein